MRTKLYLLVALTLTAALTACGPYQLTPEERQTAELGARDAADRSQADYIGCSGQDSEPDGYVSCEIRGRSAPNAVTALACSYRNGARGCKRK